MRKQGILGIQVMMPYNHIVRDVFLVLLTMTAIGIALSGTLHNATVTFNPFLPERFNHGGSAPYIRLPAINAPASASAQPLGKITAKTGNSSKIIEVAVFIALNFCIKYHDRYLPKELPNG